MNARLAIDRFHEPEAVTDVAVGWARRLGATLDLLFVLPGPPTPDEDLVHEQLLERIPVPIRGSVIVRQGRRPADQIVADLEGCHLVMVGTHGRRGLSHLVMGSVAERVVRTCPVPVMVLQSAPTAGALRVLIGVSGTFSEAARTVTATKPWLAELGAEADLVHVERLADTTPLWIDPAGIDVKSQTVLFEAMAARREQERSDLMRLLGEMPEPMRGMVRTLEGEPARRIAEAARDYDLTVLATHGRTGIDSLWLGSVAEAAIRLAPKTVLVLRLPEAERTP